VELDNLLWVVAVAAAVPLLRGLLPRTPFPGPVLELVAGIVLGPSLLGLVEADEAVRTLGLLGLAFLLLLAGLEIDLGRLRGRLGGQAAAGLGASLVLALAGCAGLAAAGLLQAPLLVAVALVGTSLGLVVPVLADSGLLDRPLGRTVVAGASAGEIASILGLSLLFGMGAASGAGLRALALLGVVAVAVAVVLLAGRRPAVRRALRSMAARTGMLRVRLAVLLLLGLVVAAEGLGFEAVLGAFVAGVVLRAVDPDAETDHPRSRIALDGLAHGFLVPVFFVGSGLTFDLESLLADPAALLQVPVLLALLLLVRAVPAVVYRDLSRRERVATGLLQATTLPLLVTAAQIGTGAGLLGSSDAAALVAAGLVSVVVLPALALRVAPAVAPSMTRPSEAPTVPV
jgi:Kef-type K+ transport system membrane component KefB